MEIINCHSCSQKITSIGVKSLQASVVNLNHYEMFWETGPKYNSSICFTISGFFSICIQAEKRFRWRSGLSSALVASTLGHPWKFIFIDFCSAFNSIQRHRVINKLQGLQVPSPLIPWIDHFQVVKVDNSLSPTVVLNTGVPQGCVLSPFLYILYTNDCQSPFTNIHYFKYADDTAILALLKNSDANSFLDYQHILVHGVTTIFYILTFQRLKNCLLALLKHRFIQVLILMERWLRECSILDTLELHWMIISVLISIF